MYKRQLLGRSGPVGIVLAGLLFAALSTGGRFMETNQGVPLDLVQVIQVLVVLFIAAPPLVRTLIGLRRIDHPGAGARRARRTRAVEVPATVGAAAGASTAAGTAGTTADGPAAGGSDGSSSGGAHRADVPVDGGAPPGDAPPTGASGTGTHARQDPSDGTAPASERGEDTTDAQEDHR